MRLRHKRALAAVGLAVLALASASPASASETIGACIAEEIEHLEGEGHTVGELLEATDEESEKLLEEFEEAVEDCQEAPSPIIPEINEIIWGGLAFLVLFGVMWKYAFPVVKNAMEARTQRIRDDLDAAEQAKDDADRVRQEYQAQLADAKAESGRIIEQARVDADQVRADLVARAEADVAESRARAAGEVESMRRQAIADLEGEVADIAIGAAERVVGSSLDRSTQEDLVEQYIRELTSS